jgi:hypothetical protein
MAPPSTSDHGSSTTEVPNASLIQPNHQKVATPSAKSVDRPVESKNDDSTENDGEAEVVVVDGPAEYLTGLPVFITMTCMTLVMFLVLMDMSIISTVC